MIPPTPWRVTSLRPDDWRVYVVDRTGTQVFDMTLPRDLAAYVVDLANRDTLPEPGR